MLAFLLHNSTYLYSLSDRFAQNRALKLTHHPNKRIQVSSLVLDESSSTISSNILWNRAGRSSRRP